METCLTILAPPPPPPPNPFLLAYAKTVEEDCSIFETKGTTANHTKAESIILCDNFTHHKIGTCTFQVKFQMSCEWGMN